MQHSCLSLSPLPRTALCKAYCGHFKLIVICLYAICVIWMTAYCIYSHLLPTDTKWPSSTRCCELITDGFSFEKYNTTSEINTVPASGLLDSCLSSCPVHCSCFVCRCTENHSGSLPNHRTNIGVAQEQKWIHVHGFHPAEGIHIWSSLLHPWVWVQVYLKYLQLLILLYKPVNP